MKAYITKYALTAGIIETDQADEVKHFPFLRRISANIGKPTNFFNGTEWQETRELAVARANIMREHRIQALEKQIKKLKAKVFK
jgi:hypothetical protein